MLCFFSSCLGDLKEKRYFFRTRKRSNSKCKRAAGSGYWKVIGKEKQILASDSNQAVLGIRRSLVFCERKCSNGSKTRWVMHEYRLPYSTQVCIYIPTWILKGNYLNLNEICFWIHIYIFMQASENLEMEDWVVYSVFQRKTSTPAKQRFISQRSSTKKTRRLEDSSDLGGPPQPSSSCSSEITEVSSNGFLDQEETSPRLWFSSFSS